MKAALQRLRRGGTATDSVWGIGVELTTMASMMLTFVMLGRSLGPGGYGSYVVLYSIVSPLVTFGASGVTLALLQHVVRDHEPLGATARSCMTVSLAFGALLTGVGAVVAFLIVDGLAGIVMLVILVSEFVVSPLIVIAAVTNQAANSFSGASRVRMSQAAAKALLVTTLYAAGELSIRTLGIGSLCVNIVLALVVLHRVGRRYGFRFAPGRPRLAHVRTNLVYSVGISAASLNNDSDKTVLGANNLTEQAGLYGAAWRVVSLGVIPISSLSNASHREFLLHEEGVRGQHLRRAIRYARIGGVYGAAAGLVLALVAPLLPVVMGDGFRESVSIVRWLSPLIFLRAMTIFPLNALMGLGYTMFRSVVIVVTAAVAIALYVVLIPAHGWRGAAAGSLISETIEMIVIWSALEWAQRRSDRAIIGESRDGGAGTSHSAEPATSDEQTVSGTRGP